MIGIEYACSLGAPVHQIVGLPPPVQHALHSFLVNSDVIHK